MKSRLLAAFLFASIAIAAVLAISPQLHERLHKIGSSAQHECAATLLSSGSIEHSACEPPPVAPCKVPSTPVFRARHIARLIASLEFTRLEHAPPAHS